MTAHETFKLVSIPVVFVAAIASGLLPAFFHSRVEKKSEKYWLAIGNCLAAGIFLSSGLIHMLPDAVKGLADHDLSFMHDKYPLGMMLACCGFILVFAIERVLLPNGHDAIVVSVDNHLYHRKRRQSSMAEAAHGHSHTDDKCNGSEAQDNDASKSTEHAHISEAISKHHYGSFNTCVRSVDTPLDLTIDPCCDPLTTPTCDACIDSPAPGQSPAGSPRLGPKRNPNGKAVRPLQIDAAEQDYLLKLQSPRLSSQVQRLSFLDLAGDLSDVQLRLRYHSRVFERGLKTGIDVANALAAPQGKRDSRVHIHERKVETAAFNAMPYITMAVLSLHSFLTGLAVGTSDSATGQEVIIMSALLIHKISAAVSLCIVFLKSEMKLPLLVKLLLIFATSTPLGIAVGIAIDSPDSIISAVFMALASGTFLYVAIVDNMVEEFVESRAHMYSKFVAFLVGFAVMSSIPLFES